MAVGGQLAGGQIQLQLAHIHGAVALGVGGVDEAACKNLSGRGLRGRCQLQQRLHGERVLVAVDPQGVGGAVDASVQAEVLKGRIAEHLQQRVQRHVLEVAGHFSVDGDGDYVGWELGFDGRCVCFAVACGGWLERRLTRKHGQPVNQGEVAIDLAALTEVDLDRVDQQRFGVGVESGVQLKAGGHNAGSDVRGIVNVDATVNTEAIRLAGSVQIQMGKALGRKGVAGHCIDQAQIQLTNGLALPAGIIEAVQRAGDLQRAFLYAAAFGGDAQGMQRGHGARQVHIARQARLSGKVRLVAVVAPNGSVKHTQPVGGNPVLLQSAAEAVMQWKYAPAPEENADEQVEIFFAPE